MAVARSVEVVLPNGHEHLRSKDPSFDGTVVACCSTVMNYRPLPPVTRIPRHKTKEELQREIHSHVRAFACLSPDEKAERLHALLRDTRWKAVGTLGGQPFVHEPEEGYATPLMEAVW